MPDKPCSTYIFLITTQHIAVNSQFQGTATSQRGIYTPLADNLVRPTGEGLSAECHRVGTGDSVKSEQLHHKNMGGHFSAVATAVGEMLLLRLLLLLLFLLVLLLLM